MSSVVADVMTPNVVSVREHAQYKDIILIMRERGFSACPVLDANDAVIGVVSEDDLLVKEAYAGQEPAGKLARLFHRTKATALTARQLMTHPAISVRPDATVAEAARTMHVKRVKRLPVVTAQGNLVGIVSRVDLLGVYDRPDSEIESEIRKGVIVDEFVLDAQAFSVTVVSGVVTISGSVENDAVAISLLDAIRQVDGVVVVRDRLRYPQR
ncbi:MAG TPA: CBS domain-containing protein [Streptosporangiaceae bacterium]|nr:CBS domain-containing protein [Streptosporangiaceae bacterium]